MHNVIVVTGATGFIGRRLVDFLAARANVAVRLMVRNRASVASTPFQAELAEGDMRDPAAFGRVLESGCTWINLAHLDLARQSEHVEVMSSLLKVCRRQRVRRLIHCSTAVVVGRGRENVITEDTSCQPGNHYEATKYAIEQCLLRESANFMEVVVLRPTAVFGPDGRNLLKLARDIEQRPALLSYLHSCLQGARRLNLVHVDNVVAALAFLLDARDGVSGETFIISDDESPLNNYREVERRLMTGLGIPDYRVPPVFAPPWMLLAALRFAGRTNVNPNRVYDDSKIIGRGLRKPVPFDKGLADFITWYRNRSAAQTPG